MSDRSFVVVAVLVVLCMFGGGCFGWPQYNVWKQRLEGEAELAKAEYFKRVAVQEAQAKRDSASMLAEAEVERAKGVAEANRIIGESLKENDAYLRYLWIQQLAESPGDVVYVPTEANLPILEANRRQRLTPAPAP